MSGAADRERLALLAHELRSPVAALTALTERAPAAVAHGLLPQVVGLARAAARDLSRLLADPDLLSLRVERIALARVVEPLAGARVAVAADGVDVDADPTRLRQALANLVANGLRHGSSVSIEARRDGDRAVVTVRDDGPGVGAGVDPFARGVSGAGSTGYGLWLARAIVEAHGGSLTLDPPDGGGATFRLWLPAAGGGRG